jgi:4-hydroxybutyryl-CoA dehydratase / vinylacetyl-CoA-Delta-isomerase
MVHELAVIPTRKMALKDRTAAFLLPFLLTLRGGFMFWRANPESVRVTGGPINHGNRLLEYETLVIFDKVSVSWERVFSCREWEFTGSPAERFAS